MSSPQEKKDAALPVFPVGPAGKRELRKALRLASTDPAKTISSFQQKHSLHSMMARAFGTTPRHEFRTTRNATETKTVESLDTDSVMTFLSHLGVRQYEVHKRLSDTLMKHLEDEIRKSKSKESLLELLKSCWMYATTIPELRPVLWAVLKQLGEETPLAVLTALAERDVDGQLKHPDIFKPLPALLKRLCWEADWDSRVQLPKDESSSNSPQEYLVTLQSTLLYEAVEPFMNQYFTTPLLVDAADRPFVATVRERRVSTKQRRALATPTSLSTSSSSVIAAAVSSTNLLRSATQQVGGTTLTKQPGVLLQAPTSDGGSFSTSGKAVAQLRSLLCDAVGSTSTVRPKLLYALLSILMAQHGAHPKDGDFFLAGSKHLHCTLVADILLSAGGPLPKAYQHVLSLAQVLDECVQEGNISDHQLAKIQAALREIFQPDEDVKAASTSTPTKAQATQSDQAKTKPEAPSSSLVRQLNRIITSGLTAMKESDPQQLFLNPVTDAIAPGYSKVISNPMSIVTMERKVKKNEYTSVAEWEQDVKLMFKNCIDYNRGSKGQWFRGEALRQGKIFREEIYPQARRHYQTEIAKRTGTAVAASEDPSAQLKRKADDEGPAITPLPASSKKRKKETKEEYLPSMPALACMLLADPFVERIVIARILRELRHGVINGSSIPAAHAVVPSLLQLVHMARWSRQICAVRGKRYFIPDSGIPMATNTQDLSTFVPFATLRRFVPLLLRLFLEAELDRRVTQGGDFHAVSQTVDFQLEPIKDDCWQENAQMEVAVSLVQGALIFICQPGMGNEASLAVTFPKFAVALQRLSDSLCEDYAFFLSLVQVLSRHKAKLPIPTRDAIVSSWLDWLRNVRTDKGSLSTSAHEYLLRLLNEWASLGNKVLPRDTLVQLTVDAVMAVESTTIQSGSFAELWKSDAPEFKVVKDQYERMLKLLPAAQVEQWKQKVGLGEVPANTQGSSEENHTA